MRANRARVKKGLPHNSHIDNVTCVSASVSPIPLNQGFHFDETISGIPTSFFLDTGAAMTLLCLDTWAKVTADCLQELKRWSALKDVGVDGSPLIIYGSAALQVQIGGKQAVVSPLTTEAILGLDFLHAHQALIDLAKHLVNRHGVTLTESRSWSTNIQKAAIMPPQPECVKV